MQVRIETGSAGLVHSHAVPYTFALVKISGDRVKERRQKLGLSQERVGELAGVSQVTISRAERGDIARGFEGTLGGIARALQCSEAYLRGETDTPDEVTDQPSSAHLGAGTTNANRINWPALRAAAKIIDPTLPDWTLDALETSPSMTTLSIQPTPMAVVDLAKVILRHGRPPET